jgi:hypothetical protein
MVIPKLLKFETLNLLPIEGVELVWNEAGIEINNRTEQRTNNKIKNMHFSKS